MYVIEDLRIEPRQKLSQMYCKNNGCHFFKIRLYTILKCVQLSDSSIPLPLKSGCICFLRRSQKCDALAGRIRHGIGQQATYLAKLSSTTVQRCQPTKSLNNELQFVPGQQHQYISGIHAYLGIRADKGRALRIRPKPQYCEGDSSIFRQSSNPVCGSWESQASSPWAKHIQKIGILVSCILDDQTAQSLTCHLLHIGGLIRPWWKNNDMPEQPNSTCISFVGKAKQYMYNIPWLNRAKLLKYNDIWGQDDH